jgi:hypothetical protein
MYSEYDGGGPNLTPARRTKIVCASLQRLQSAISASVCAAVSSGDQVYFDTITWRPYD